MDLSVKGVVYQAHYHQSQSQRSSGSKIMVPVESPLLVFYLMFFESIIICLTVFEIFEVKLLRCRSQSVQGQPRSKDMVPVDSAQVVSYSTSVDDTIVDMLSGESAAVSI